MSIAMNINVGDYVSWDFRQHCFDSGASIGYITPKTLFKGHVEKVKTHDLFFFKRNYPLYKVNGVWVRRVKPVVTVKYKKWVSPDGSSYEADSYIVTKVAELVNL